MNAADWRALIEALLEGRLSADAFARRFMEALREARDSAQAVPAAIQRIAATVENYSATARPGHPFERTEEQVRAAAAEALSGLQSDPVGARTYDRARAQEEWRRLRMQVSGCAGLGCIVALLWVGLCLLQWTAVSAQVQQALGWEATPATIVGLVLAFIPIVGNIIAFLGATEIWGWHPLVAGVVFFAAPAATIFTGWTRWRRYGR